MRCLAALFSCLAFAAPPSFAFAPIPATSIRSIAIHPPVRPSSSSPSSSSLRVIHAFPDDVASTTSALASTLTIARDVFDSSSLVVSTSSTLFDADSIKIAFNVATFFPQLPWLFLIFLPNGGVTRRLLGGYGAIALCCLVHFFIVTASIVQPDGTAPMAEFADVFDPNGDPQGAMIGMMRYPNFVSEEWSHVLTWDLFVGRWIWLDGLKRGVFTSHSVLLTNLIGPPGLLLHWSTCALTGRGFLPPSDTME